MANVCNYCVQVKGSKNACLMIYSSMPVYDEKRIESECNDQETYKMVFSGDCKWSVNWDVNDNFTALSNIDQMTKEEIKNAGLDYWECSLRKKSEIFACEILARYWSSESEFDQFDYYKNGKCIKKRKIRYDEANVFDWDKTEYEGHTNIYDNNVQGEESDFAFMNILNQLSGGPSYSQYEFDDIDKITIVGKNYVLTGLSTKDKTEVSDIVKANSGEVKGSVSRQTDYLIVNENFDHLTAKYLNAREIRKTQNRPFIISYTTFKSILGSLGREDGLIQMESSVIKKRCYYKNSQIEEFTVPEGITDIQEEAFRECKNLTKIVLPASLRTINEKAFMGCKKLEEIVFSDGLEKIEKSAFEGCNSLKEIKFPNTLTIIKERAFSGCTKIESITFNEGLKEIHGGAFAECKRLSTIALPESLEYLGEGEKYPDPKFAVFYMCKKVSLVHIGKNLKRIPGRCFCECSNLSKIEFSDNLKDIGDYAFEACMKLKSIRIPESVDYIGYGAFSECENLEEIFIEKNVAVIENGVFGKCFSLNKIDIDQNNESFVMNDGFLINKKTGEACAFISNDQEEIHIPNGTILLGDRLFWGNENVKKIVISDQVKKIGTSAFLTCRNLSEVILTDNLKEIGNFAFCGCENLEKIVLPYGLKKIGVGAFGSYMMHITRNDKYERIEEGCPIKEIVIPGSVEDVGNLAFDNCTKLEKVVYETGITSICKHNIDDCPNVQEISLPDTLLEIEREAFQYCNSLKELIIPESVKTLDGPASCCSNLKTMKIMGMDTKIIYIDTERGFVLYVREGSEAQKYAKEHRIKSVVF